MRWSGLLFALLLAGCENVVGPFRRTPVRVDDPRLSIQEQEKRSRQFLGLPDESPLAGPHSGIVRPGTDANR